MGLIFPYQSKVLNLTSINHDVLSLRITKPRNFEYNTGQVVDLSIDKSGYELSVASFTIANKPTDNYLEFIIKVYPRKKGITEAISELQPNATIQLSEAWDSYKYAGSGTFIAAGAGITAFLPLFKEFRDKGINIQNEHKLIYANKTKDDILFHKELKQLFSSKLTLVLSRNKLKNVYYGKIDENYLSKYIQNMEEKFYICGPKRFEKNIKEYLITSGVSQNHIQTGYEL